MVANGQGTIPALIAAVLSDKIATVKLQNGLDSWMDVLNQKIPAQFALSSTLFGILAETDLPELRQAISHKIIQ